MRPPRLLGCTEIPRAPMRGAGGRGGQGGSTAGWKTQKCSPQLLDWARGFSEGPEVGRFGYVHILDTSGWGIHLS